MRGCTPLYQRLERYSNLLHFVGQPHSRPQCDALYPTAYQADDDDDDDDDDADDGDDDSMAEAVHLARTPELDENQL